MESSRRIAIDLSVAADHPDLLAGLEAWRQLGLLSDAQIRELARSALTCPLPLVVETEELSLPVAVPPAPARMRRSPLVPQILRSLMAEVSVVWLLFLGVFLVVVSSGVLAATQWQNFSPIGQYAILLSYTIAFWVAAEWTGKQSALRLTSRMLQITTLLIIPVNFWMIDGFRLWQSGAGIVVAAIAAIGLSIITLRLLCASPRLMQINSLALGWLHGGWSIVGVPLIATYLGTIATAGLQLRSERRQGEVGVWAIAVSTLLLIGRAVLRAGVPLSQLGLAFGISGWLLAWLNRRDDRPLWTQAGAGLLLFGWAVTVGVEPPWQAIAISGLGLWLLGDRLRQTGQVQLLLALFLVGLQAYSLLWQLLPIGVRQTILVWMTQLAGPAVQPWHLIGLGLLPYLALTVVGAIQLRRRQQTTLAAAAERVALGFGVLLAIVSSFHPWTRSLDLTLSGLLLAIVLRSAPTTAGVYLTHSTGLLALFSWIDWRFPTLDGFAWSLILLGIMLVEWSVLFGRLIPLWQQSAWHLGLVLAGLSYSALAETTPDRALVWLIVPTLLTLLAYRDYQPQLASRFSLLALLLVQGLTFDSATPFLISTGAATGLMLLNTRQLSERLRRTGGARFSAIVTVGLGLACYAAGVWQVVGDIPVETGPTWLAIALVGLWLLRWVLRSHSLYAPALDGWAIGLCLLTLGWLTLMLPASSNPSLLAAVLVTGALILRLNQSATDAGFYGVAWSSELAIVTSLRLLNATPDVETIVHLALGLLTQLGGDWWVRRTATSYRFSWHVIPLLFALLGGGLAQRSFTAVTGLYLLAASLPLMGVGRRQAWFRPLTYLGIAGSSFAAYVLLTYQLMQQSGGEAGDGLALMAALGVGIAGVDRLAVPWLLRLWRLTLPELRVVAHVHWLVGSVFALGALVLSLSNGGSGVWVAVMLALAVYAGWQGRTTPAWVVAAVGHFWLGLCYLLYRSLPEQFWAWIAAIAVVVAIGLYHLPWRKWGWQDRPWQRSAALLPGVMTGLTLGAMALPAIWVVAGFYAWLAAVERRTRLSYLSLLLANWALLRLFWDWNSTLR